MPRSKAPLGRLLRNRLPATGEMTALSRLVKTSHKFTLLKGRHPDMTMPNQRFFGIDEVNAAIRTLLDQLNGNGAPFRGDQKGRMLHLG